MVLFGPSWTGRRDALGRALPPHGLVLDVGCGSGLLLSRAASRYPAAIGIDPSRHMLRRARDQGVNVIGARADSIPLAGSSVNAVICTYPGPWIQDANVWSEIARIGAPGATVTILLGGTVTDGRFSSVRSRLIGLIYGLNADGPMRLPPGIGHALIPGELQQERDAWGYALIWRGVRSPAI